MKARGCSIRMLAAARLISFAGGQAAQMALLYSIYEVTGSAMWVSTALFASAGVVGLLGPVSGWIGDRFPRRAVMIASELGAGVGYLALSFTNDAPLMIATALIAAALNAPFKAASIAAVPNLVDEDHLNWANGLLASALSAGMIAGPIIGGALVALGGPDLVFQLNALSFVVSAAIVGQIKVPFGKGEPRCGNVQEGLKVLIQNPKLRGLVAASALAWGAFGIALVADLPLALRVQAGSMGYGLLTSSWGGGALLGAWLAGRKLRPGAEGRAVVLGTLSMAVSLGATALLPTFPLIVLVGMVGGVGSGLFFVPWFTLIQRSTDDHVRGRVIGIAEALEVSAFVLGMFGAGPLIDRLGAQPTYLVPAALLVAGAFVVKRLGREATNDCTKEFESRLGQAKPAPV